MSYGGRLEAFFTAPSSSSLMAPNSSDVATSVSLTSAAYTTTSFCAHLQARLNAVVPPSSGSWAVSVSTGAGGTGLVTITRTGTWSITFTTAEIGTVLGFTENISSATTSATGTQNARGLWLPKCPAMLDTHPSSAPKVTDARSVVTPTGDSYALVGTSRHRHRGLRWTHLHSARVHRVDETTTHASLEQWLDDTQFAAGHSWFRPGSAFQVYWSNNGTDSIVGSALNGGAGPTYGWTAQPAISEFRPEFVQQGLISYWSWGIPELIGRG